MTVMLWAFLAFFIYAGTWIAEDLERGCNPFGETDPIKEMHCAHQRWGEDGIYHVARHRAEFLYRRNGGNPDLIYRSLLAQYAMCYHLPDRLEDLKCP